MPWLTQEISHKVLKNSSFITQKISLQNISLSPIVEHCHKNAYICYIYFEDVSNGITLQWQFRNLCVIASAYYSCILQPLNTTYILWRPSTFLNNWILEFLIFLRQLFRNWFKTFSDTCFVCIIRILNHILFVFGYKVALHIIYLFNIFSFQETIHDFRQTTYNDISVQQFHHSFMDTIRDCLFILKTWFDWVDDCVTNSICP